MYSMRTSLFRRHLSYYRMSPKRTLPLIRTNSFTETPTMQPLRDSIYVPKWLAPPASTPLPGDSYDTPPEWAATKRSRWYGTKEQTVMLVSRTDGRVVYTERTLWDENNNALD